MIFFKKVIKEILLFINRLIKNRHKIISHTPYWVLSDGDNATYFGYHDKTPFSLDGNKILAMSLEVSDSVPENEGSIMKLGYFQKRSKGDFGNEFISFAITTTWCYQQGCMLQWLPQYPNRKVIYNTLLEGSYGSVIFNLVTGEKEKEYYFPIYSLAKNGQLAVSLNFSRLGRLRPGYGYNNLPDYTINDNAPKDDGLFLCDFLSSNRELIVSLYELAKEVDDLESQHYINHATFSPDNNSIIFFHLWLTKEGRRMNRLLLYRLQTKNIEVIEDERSVSHYCWINDNDLLVTTKSPQKRQLTTYSVISVGNKIDIFRLRESDTHPMMAPNSFEDFVMDSYPDNLREQHLYLANIKQLEPLRIASLYSPFRYSGMVRCDLHPRWDMRGNYIAVDSACLGKRKLLVFEVSKFNKKK